MCVTVYRKLSLNDESVVGSESQISRNERRADDRNEFSNTLQQEVSMFTPSVLLSSFSYMIELLPFHLLAYYPFRGQFRFPLWAVLSVNGFFLSVQFFLYSYQYSIGNDIRTLDILVALISMITYLAFVKVDIGKLLFIYILVVDYIMIVRGIAAFLEIRFFMEPGETYYLFDTPGKTIFRMIPLVLTSPFMLIFLNIMKERVLQTRAPQLWRTIWLIPAHTSFIVLLFTWDLNMIHVSGLAFLLARVCLLTTIFIVYYVLVSSLKSLKLQGEAEERARNQEHIMAMQRTQYSMLQKQIEETRHARHDLKQHLNVIRGCLESGDVAQLKDYITKYGQKLSALSPRTYCSNYAVDACTAEPGESPFIRIHARVAGERAISITVDNSCPNPPVMKDGFFLLSKHSGKGTGTISIRNIAAQYNGIVDFKYKAGVFYASVFLNPYT